VKRIGHSENLLFAILPTALSAHRLQGRVARARVQPTRECGTLRERVRLSGETGENFLRHVLRPVGITARLAQCGMIDEAEVSPDEFSESRFRASVGVLAKESGVIVHGVS
jgi:hypothetical protein